MDNETPETKTKEIVLNPGQVSKIVEDLQSTINNISEKHNTMVDNMTKHGYGRIMHPFDPEYFGFVNDKEIKSPVLVYKNSTHVLFRPLGQDLWTLINEDGEESTHDFKTALHAGIILADRGVISDEKIFDEIA